MIGTLLTILLIVLIVMLFAPIIGWLIGAIFSILVFNLGAIILLVCKIIKKL
ncbi:hypothetical protein [Clostridium pasteurianum]|uniref:hypothetical protein n=1 Tax=Clostridium pasteurianum TaxID=1501 RepID=UPI0015C3E4C4|nr:hypothetical protein [Clostridium pasteurianum]